MTVLADLRRTLRDPLTVRVSGDAADRVDPRAAAAGADAARGYDERRREPLGRRARPARPLDARSRRPSPRPAASVVAGAGDGGGLLGLGARQRCHERHERVRLGGEADRGRRARSLRGLRARPRRPGLGARARAARDEPGGGHLGGQGLHHQRRAATVVPRLARSRRPRDDDDQHLVRAPLRRHRAVAAARAGGGNHRRRRDHPRRRAREPARPLSRRGGSRGNRPLARRVPVRGAGDHRRRPARDHRRRARAPLGQPELPAGVVRDPRPEPAGGRRARLVEPAADLRVPRRPHLPREPGRRDRLVPGAAPEGVRALPARTRTPAIRCSRPTSSRRRTASSSRR